MQNNGEREKSEAERQQLLVNSSIFSWGGYMFPGTICQAQAKKDTEKWDTAQ